MAATSAARVYRLRAEGDAGWEFYGCLFRRKRPHLLGTAERLDNTGDDGFTTPRLAGRYVGWGDFARSSQGSVFQVKVLDLRSGRKKWDVPTGRGPTTDLELKTNGSVAWIAGPVFGAPNPPDNRVVVRADSNGEAVLDDGPGIESASLARSDSTLYWRKFGQAFSASLD